jgi:hypothetical protein
MDEGHLPAAARYVSLNPVRARLVARTKDRPWPSEDGRFPDGAMISCHRNSGLLSRRYDKPYC